MAVYVIPALEYRGPAGAKVGYPVVQLYAHPGRPASTPEGFRKVVAAFKAKRPDLGPRGVYTLAEALASEDDAVRLAAEEHQRLKDEEANRPPRPRGFAAMSPEKRRELASRGGSAVPPEKRPFANTAAARAAGAKGGARNAARIHSKQRALAATRAYRARQKEQRP